MHLLLIEDDPLIAHELRLRWRGAGWSVHACTSLRAADEALANQSAHAGFNLIVLDLGLPDGDGLDWLRRLRRNDRTTPVLVLTARDRVSDRVEGLRGGADDYLVKPFAPEELDARVDVLTRRAQRARGELLQFGSITWLRDEGRAYASGRPLDLPRREFEVLGMLMQRAPQLVTKRALLDALAERNLELGDAAAEVYISRLRRRLDGCGVGIQTSRGFGYRLVLDEGGRP